LKEHEADVSLADPCRKNGVSDSSFYKWKAKFGGMEVSEAERLKMLEDENTRLKRLLADAAMLDNAALAHRTRAIFGADLLSSDRIPSRDSPISGETRDKLFSPRHSAYPREPHSRGCSNSHTIRPCLTTQITGWHLTLGVTN